jgi:hypothetical protein
MKKSILKFGLNILYTIAVILFGAISCNWNMEIKEPEFFLIEKIPSQNGVVETIVIANPPKDSTKLKFLVEQYNLNTIPLDTFKKYKTINRQFYKETDLLTRHYERFEPYPNEDNLSWYARIYYKRQDLANHHDDLVMVTLFSKRHDDSIAYRYCFNYEDYLSNMHKKIIDLDSIYLEGVGF